MTKYLFTLFLSLCFAGTVSARELYVLTVGIDDYKSINDLKRAENDAKDQAKLWATHTKHVKTLLGTEATHKNILSTIRSFFAQAGEDDAVVFCFSGHGGKGGLCAYDTSSEQTMISYSEVQAALRTCHAKKKMLFIDACFAGGLRTSKTNSTSQSNPFTGDEGVMLFLASRSNETSAENAYSRNGYFTQYLLLGLKGKADSNSDKVITAKEIYTYVSNNVKKRTRKKQNPVMWGKFDDDMPVISWRQK